MSHELHLFFDPHWNVSSKVLESLALPRTLVFHLSWREVDDPIDLCEGSCQELRAGNKNKKEQHKMSFKGLCFLLQLGSIEQFYSRCCK